MKADWITRVRAITLGLGFLLALPALAGCNAGSGEAPEEPAAEATATDAPPSAAASTPPQALRPNPIDVAGSASLGPANAPVTLVEYSDFQ